MLIKEDGFQGCRVFCAELEDVPISITRSTVSSALHFVHASPVLQYEYHATRQ